MTYDKGTMYMRQQTKILLGGLLVVIALIAFERWVLQGVYSSLLWTGGTEVSKEVTELETARALVEAGDTEKAGEIYQSLIAETRDDIVYERALRDQSRLLAELDPAASLASQISLATDMRVRATARAGAIENLAELYFIDSGYTTEALDAAIFGNETFAALRYAGENAPSSERLLLEYANRVSVRPLTSAYLMREYGEAWFTTGEDMKVAFDEVFSLYETLMVDVPASSPNAPKAHAAAAAGLLYARAADQSDPDYLPDNAITSAIQTSEEMIQLFSEVFETPIEDLQYGTLAPLSQFATMLEAAEAVPYTAPVEGLLAAYDAYLTAHPYVDVATHMPELVDTVASVRAKVDAAVAAEPVYDSSSETETETVVE